MSLKQHFAHQWQHVEKWRDLRTTGCMPPPGPRLKTGLLYRWLPHPMYVGVLLAMWATQRMSVGHMLLSAGMTAHVLFAKRYEERDLAARFGTAYTRWRAPRFPSASAG